MSGNIPMGVTENDPYFDDDEPQDDQEEPAQCQVIECEQPQAPLDIYCVRCGLVADDMKRLYDGAAKAGWFEGDRQ